MDAADSGKRMAAEAALALVEPGMRLGLGTGSTARHFVAALAERVAAGLAVRCVATSRATEAQAGALGIPLATLDEEPELDLAVDGADEIGPRLALIKGGGGALLREKLVAVASRRFVVIADASKLVPVLGRFPLPVEIVPFGREATARRLAGVLAELGLGGAMRWRQNGTETFVTDNGNVILDLALGAIPDPAALATALDRLPGVVEHGLFVELCSRAYVASPDGVAEHVGSL